jgi:hypothetical protein
MHLFTKLLPDEAVPWFLVALGLLLAAVSTSLFLLFRRERQPGERPGLGLIIYWGIGGILVVAGLWRLSKAEPQDRAVAAIKRFHGEVMVDEKAATKPVVRVDFDRPIYDDGLGQLTPHLRALPQLRHLRITSMALITDAGLKHLEGLTQLETIEVYGFKITAAAVEDLKRRLPNVKVHHTPSGPGTILLPDLKVLGNGQK